MFDNKKLSALHLYGGVVRIFFHGYRHGFHYNLFLQKIGIVNLFFYICVLLKY